jgi:hypothetical protein
MQTTRRESVVVPQRVRSVGPWLLALGLLLGGVLASVSTSQFTNYVRFDWNSAQLQAEHQHPPGRAPFWLSQAEWEKRLRQRGLFVVHAEDGTMDVHDSDTVQEYLNAVVATYTDKSIEFVPPSFAGRPVPVDSFSSLLNDFLTWTNERPQTLSTAELLQPGYVRGAA